MVVAEQLAAGGNAHLMGIHVNVSMFQADTSKNAVLLPSLVPATSYRLSLAVLGRNSLWSWAVTLVCSTSAEGRQLLCAEDMLPQFHVFLGMSLPGSWLLEVFSVLQGPALSSGPDLASLIP